MAQPSPVYRVPDRQFQKQTEKPMKRLPALMVLLASAFVSQASLADEALAKSKGCLGCHGIDKKIVGPAYKDVAQKYTGQNVTDQLAEKVIKGGGGVWGGMAMPPNAVSPEEAKKLVSWVLSLK
jgi:cytochrome c